MKVGDLVRNISDPRVGLGIITAVDIPMLGYGRDPTEPPGIKVLWNSPTWHDPVDGASVMYGDEVELVNEARRSNIV